MISKRCQLTDKEKLYVTLHHECEHFWNKVNVPDRDRCAGCPYMASPHIPIIRRVFPRLIAEEIFGVQPMMGPTGLGPKFKFVYKGKKKK